MVKKVINLERSTTGRWWVLWKGAWKVEVSPERPRKRRVSARAEGAGWKLKTGLWSEGVTKGGVGVGEVR